MRKFARIEAVAAPLPLDNMDTDQILPARFLSRKRDEGLADCCFHDLRFAAESGQRSDFVLNLPAYAGARILVTGSNFGCGSSREGAVHALADLGMQVVLAKGFGEIFQQNALLNGLLAIVLPEQQIERLSTLLSDAPGTVLAVDLEHRLISGQGVEYAFAIDPFHRECLLAGLDQIDFTLQYLADIERFDRSGRAPAPLRS